MCQNTKINAATITPLTLINFQGACHSGFGTRRASFNRTKAVDCCFVAKLPSNSPVVLLRRATMPADAASAEDDEVVEDVVFDEVVLKKADGARERQGEK